MDRSQFQSIITESVKDIASVKRVVLTGQDGLDRDLYSCLGLRFRCVSICSQKSRDSDRVEVVPVDQNDVPVTIGVR